MHVSYSSVAEVRPGERSLVNLLYYRWFCLQSSSTVSVDDLIASGCATFSNSV